jgi:hypothetical protein
VIKIYREGRISVTIRPTKLKISTGLLRLVKMMMNIQWSKKPMDPTSASPRT